MNFVDEEEKIFSSDRPGDCFELFAFCGLNSNNRTNFDIRDLTNSFKT